MKAEQQTVELKARPMPLLLQNVVGKEMKRHLSINECLCRRRLIRVIGSDNGETQ